MVLEHIEYIVQDLYSKGFKKLVPLAKDSNTPNVGRGGVLEIADNPNHWTPAKLAENYHKFHNIATTFGPQLLADGSIGYNHCLDVDSDVVRAAIEPYVPELKELTYIVQTKKGLHIHWLEHNQHERIGSTSAGRNVRRCMPGSEFEIKTDHRGGLAHLPSSKHRDDVKQKVPNPFRYHSLEGCAGKVGVINNFMASGLGLYDFLLQYHILGHYVREPNETANRVSRIREKLPKQEDEEEVPKSEQHRDGPASDSIVMSGSNEDSENQIRSAPIVDNEEEDGDDETAEEADNDNDDYYNNDLEEPTQAVVKPSNLHFICADRIYNLVEKWYIKDHRNNAMLCITGAIRRSWSDIAYEDAEHIIGEFCKTAGDEEMSARLSMLGSTYDKEDVSEVAGFGPFNDILSKLEPDMSTDKQTQTISDIRHGIYAALDDFKANSILERYPNIEIDRSKHRHIVIFDHTVEEVEFPQARNSILKETVRSVERKSLLLNAAPIPLIQEVWDPIYAQTKYKISFRSIGKAGKVVTKEQDQLMTIDELERWLSSNGSYYHKQGKLGEVIHAVIDSYTKAGLVNNTIGTEIEGLVFLPNRKGGGGRSKLVLSNMARPSVPTQEQAQACIKLIQDIQKKFYGSSGLEGDRHAHFLKVGVVAPIDFTRRQSGAVNQYDIIPRQDLGGWTDSGKSFGYSAIPLRMYKLPLNKGVGQHSYVVGSGSIDTAARFIEQTRWTTMPVIFDEADRYSDWEEDREARRILSILKNSTTLTNPRDTLTSDSEQITKPSAAYVMLTHNSPVILEDGFSRRCTGHEFTSKDAKTPGQKDAFNKFWKDAENSNTFGYLGDFIINYYLDHPEVLNNTWLDIARIVLRAFWVDAAGLPEIDFTAEWSRWLGNTVVSATSKDGLIESRIAAVVSMLRNMVNEAWARNRQPAAIWIAKKIRGKINAGEHDYNTGEARLEIDDAIATATFAEKLEALIKTDNLTHLVWHPKYEVTIDSSIIDEMKSRYHIYRVTHKGLADLLGFECDTIRFSNGVRKAIHAPLEQFTKKIAPKNDGIVAAVEGV
jgi:hypothetical protein